jgi:hypothetical protein
MESSGLTRELNRARKVNKVWLTGWGCQLQRLRHFQVIENRVFSEYNAVFDVVDPEYVPAALDRAESIRGILYLPREARFVDARKGLVGVGWHPILRSATVASSIANVSHRSDPLISLALVEERSLDSWVRLYHLNYGMADDLLEPNRRRWELAFWSEPAIHFYFVIVDGERVGTVQLVAPANDFCGVYSFTMRSHRNGLPFLRAIARTLFSEAIHLGAPWMCYERLRHIKREPSPPQTIAAVVRWCGAEWQTLSRDIGYSREPLPT